MVDQEREREHREGRRKGEKSLLSSSSSPPLPVVSLFWRRTRLALGD
jgi:hypothetical protein